jgi:hypothetical protein
MMTPKFEDVVEYVRGGADDPEMEALLDQHPDGDELLRQARFIVRMLKRAAEETDRPGIAAKREIAAANLKRAAAVNAMRALEISSEKMSLQLSESRESFFDDDRRGDESLGTLEFSTEGERVSLSYQPSKVSMRFRGKPYPKFELPESGVEGIEIRGAGITLSLPDAVAAGEPLPVRLSHGARQMPAIGREMIFMPDSGPFVRFEADDEGKVHLPIPEASGTLRIDAGRTELLHIRVKK